MDVLKTICLESYSPDVQTALCPTRASTVTTMAGDPDPSSAPEALEEPGEKRSFQTMASAPVAEDAAPEASLALGVDNLSPAAPKKKKARRGMRKKPRQWKPYSQLSWEERRRLEERDYEKAQEEGHQPNPPPHAAASVAAPHRRGKRGGKRNRPVPPPAPRNTTQFIAEEKERSPPSSQDGSPRLPNGYTSSLSPAEAPPDHDGGLEGVGGFEEAFEAAIYDGLEDLSKSELIGLVRERDAALERLREEVAALRGRVQLSAIPSVDKDTGDSGS